MKAQKKRNRQMHRMRMKRLDRQVIMRPPESMKAVFI